MASVTDRPKRVVLTLRPAITAEARRLALSRRMSFSAWVENAVRSQIGRERRYVAAALAKAPTWPSGWPKGLRCPYVLCQTAETHDPQQHRHCDVSALLRDLDGPGGLLVGSTTWRRVDGQLVGI